MYKKTPVPPPNLPRAQCEQWHLLMPDPFPGTGSEHCWGTGAFEHTSLEESLPQLQSETYLLPLVPQVTTVLLQTGLWKNQFPKQVVFLHVDTHSVCVSTPCQAITKIKSL